MPKFLSRTFILNISGHLHVGGGREEEWEKRILFFKEATRNHIVGPDATYNTQTYLHLVLHSMVGLSTSTPHTYLKYIVGCPFECFTKTPMKQAPIQIVLPWMSCEGK